MVTSLPPPLSGSRCNALDPAVGWQCGPVDVIPLTLHAVGWQCRPVDVIPLTLQLGGNADLADAPEFEDAAAQLKAARWRLGLALGLVRVRVRLIVRVGQGPAFAGLALRS